ncbi:hypothetical protein BWQ96_09845 [Gracilariopsis chorda]|uniref:Uncharacterized protein n=1 Tax=Gracilariopsis chorda TaxID=448386 RepID=A0A2V3IED3_9FLOR|nr:hypothetical protein BWQ96_09845 [Gracilariopsis chorda]|eukprot:PXF40446.1 hypothetical protein BWQ96_09845 [Gracilariopsis chorda]
MGLDELATFGPVKYGPATCRDGPGTAPEAAPDGPAPDGPAPDGPAPDEPAKYVLVVGTKGPGKYGPATCGDAPEADAPDGLPVDRPATGDRTAAGRR